MAMIQFLKKSIFYQIVRRISQDIPFLVGKTVRTRILDKRSLYKKNLKSDI